MLWPPEPHPNAGLTQDRTGPSQPVCTEELPLFQDPLGSRWYEVFAPPDCQGLSQNHRASQGTGGLTNGKHKPSWNCTTSHQQLMDVGDGEGDRDVQKADPGKWLPVRRIFRSMMGEEGRKLRQRKKSARQSQCTALESSELRTCAHLDQSHLLAPHLGILGPAAAWLRGTATLYTLLRRGRGFVRRVVWAFFHHGVSLGVLRCRGPGAFAQDRGAGRRAAVWVTGSTAERRKEWG